MFKLYTQENCPNCEELKSFFNAKGIEYDELDVNNDTKARAFMIMNDLETTPAVAFGNDVFGGEVNEIKLKVESLV